MNQDYWTVSEHLVNISSWVGRTETTFVAANGKRPSKFEYWLCYDGNRMHVLSGDHGKKILDGFADDLNQRGYKPRLENGKLYMDLTVAERQKLAQKSSPELPLE